MNRYDFFDKFCTENKQASIINILIARGFLIDFINGGYYLSDNSDPKDLDYLKYGLNHYHLGSLSRDTGGMPYEIAKVVIDSSTDIDNAIIFFEESGRIEMESLFQSVSWSYFLQRRHGHKVPVKFLEPYVSYYVKAISACGVFTDFSCDGNHPGDYDIKVGADYPSSIWHRFMYEHILPSEIQLKNYIVNHRIPFTKETQFDRYYLLYQAADYFYRNRWNIRTLDKVEKMIAHPDGVYICNECVEICGEILKEAEEDE